MATNAVKLGPGYATGMFYKAAAGTALPTALTGVAAWGTEVGYVSQDGITLHLAQNHETLKDWSNSIRRVLPSTDSGTVQVPVISTDADSLSAVFGSTNVASTTASSTVTIKPDNIQAAAAWLLVMKDGDDVILLGTTNGYITDIADVAFQPGSAITWAATISADEWSMQVIYG